MARTLLFGVGVLLVGLLLGLVLGGIGREVSEVPNPWTKPVAVDASGLDADQREVADKLDLRAMFVRGTDLGGLHTILGGPLPPTDRQERQVFLVACLQPRVNTGPRVLGLVLEVIRPERLAGQKVALKGGLLQDDCIYHVQLMIDTDASLPGDAGTRDGKYVYEGHNLRDEIVRSRPEFRIVSMHSH
jgi:hypothetical protein